MTHSEQKQFKIQFLPILQNNHVRSLIITF